VCGAVVLRARSAWTRVACLPEVVQPVHPRHRVASSEASEGGTSPDADCYLRSLMSGPPKPRSGPSMKKISIVMSGS
jgi:hypothetical protein